MQTTMISHLRLATAALLMLASAVVRAPPKRASGEVCFPLTSTYMEVGHPDGRSTLLSGNGQKNPVIGKVGIDPAARHRVGVAVELRANQT